MTMKNSGDGLMEPFEVGGRKYWRTKQSKHGGKYVYLDLDDSFMFDEEHATLLVEIEYLDGGFGSFASEYDSIDPGASVREGAFQVAGPVGGMRRHRQVEDNHAEDQRWPVRKPMQWR